MFRWRGAEVSRLEGLSDGVFALTLTLLVINSDVPETFYELWETIVHLPVFLACFALLMWAWGCHSQFFRRYGLEDMPTLWLNAVYLFLVIFMAFPLKFLTSFLFAMFTGLDPLANMFAVPEGMKFWSAGDQGCAMIIFYGIAICGVFGVQMLMLIWAWMKRDALELDELERFLTKTSIGAQGLTCGIAALSIVIVSVWGNAPLGGFTYCLMAVAHPIYGVWAGTRAERMYRSG